MSEPPVPGPATDPTRRPEGDPRPQAEGIPVRRAATASRVPEWVPRAFGGLILLTVALLMLAREADRPPEALVARWALPPSDFVEVAGLAVHVRDEGPRGDPTPIVLLHGTSASLHTWDGWAAELSKTRRVVRLDLPGFGLTGPFTGGAGSAFPSIDAGGDHDTATLARFVLAFADRLGLPPFVLGGNSLGGEVAWRAAAAAPGRVAALVLVDAGGLAARREGLPLGWRLAAMPVLGGLLEWTLPRGMVAEGLAKAYADPSRVTPELIDRYFELTLREGNRRALRHGLQRLVARGPGDASGLERITAPTLLLWGAKDGLIPLASGQEMARRIAGSRLVVFPTLGHVPHEEDPAATLPPVQAFLAERTGPLPAPAPAGSR
jgi:pimeloyl-ACP methyl ester carboxylesterase